MPLYALQVVLVGGAVQGVMLALLLFTRQYNVLPNRLLGLLVLLISAQSILVGFDTRAFFMAFPHLSRVGWLLPTLFGPLLFLFTAKLTSEQPTWHTRDYLFLLPFLLCLLYLSPYFLQSAEAKRTYLDNFDKASEDDFGLLNQLINGLHLACAAGALLLIRQHEQNIRNNFSELRKVRLRWLRQFVQLMLGIVLLGIAAFYMRKFDLPLLSAIYHYHYLGVVICIYWIGYKALSQPVIFSGPTVLPSPESIPLEAAEAMSTPSAREQEMGGVKYQRSGLDSDTAEEYLLRLLTYMQEQKPYLEQELTIQNLADALGIPKYHLSRVINERLGKNFFDFVNQYRVEEAKGLLLNTKYSHYSILGIAMEAGFSSKATFNAVFKKMTGMTPTTFVAQTREVV